MSRFRFSCAAVVAAVMLAVPHSVSATRFTAIQHVRVQTNFGWFQFLVWDFGTNTGSITSPQDGTSNTIGVGEILIGHDQYFGVYAYDYKLGQFTDSLYFLDVGAA